MGTVDQGRIHMEIFHQVASIMSSTPLSKTGNSSKEDATSWTVYVPLTEREEGMTAGGDTATSPAIDSIPNYCRLS